MQADAHRQNYSPFFYIGKSISPLIFLFLTYICYSNDMYFFSHAENLPSDVGFGLFSITHIAWLLLISGICMIIGVSVIRKPDRIRVIRLWTASAALLFGFLEYGITAFLGSFTRFTLPLHLCSLAYVLCFLHSISDRIPCLNTLLSQILYYPCLPGVIMALSFPDWSNYPAWSYLTITGFLGHGLVLAYIISLITVHEISFRRRDICISICFIAIYAAGIGIINRALGTNYFFLMGPSTGSPLTSVYQQSGYAGYIVVYVLLGLLGLLMFYIIIPRGITAFLIKFRHDA